ncbi:C40 family peptidase [Actinospica durhamensis]|uniref:C40 family peptidase n=1 Tax=Actinospica durhamensis TaxID=1508375 RepID=A0A941IR53_9ACTN|nr:C40 family peptidase [Actinospica durhamensis]MBR7836984.1 C40 family peptidase [Actinospica durhamensis]
MSTATHRASKLVTPRKATAVAVVGLTAGTVAMVPSSSQATTLSQAKAQYLADEGKAEAAGQVYDQQEQAYAQLQQRINALQNEISSQNEGIAKLEATVGSQAAAQYRNGGVDETLELTLSASPTTYLDKVSGENEIAAQEAEQLKSLKSDQASLKQEQALAAQLIKQQQSALAAAQSAKQQADELSKEAQALVAELTPAEQQQMNIGSGGMWTHFSGTLPVVTGRNAIAVDYVESKLGDSYVYGGNGPNVFDCSGLMQEAWLAAGVSLPRTSFEMWDTETHISRSQLQPGDLIYFLEPGASASDGPGHVGMYIGNGMMIHATHPGSYVQWASIDPSSVYYVNMTILGYSTV